MKQISNILNRGLVVFVDRVKTCSRNPQPVSRNSAQILDRQGMSLIEVLISMFVLLFGLMGVAAIFPVGNHYVTEGEKYDFSSALAQNAFEELKGRGMLRSEVWHYADMQYDLSAETATQHYPATGEHDTLVMQSKTIGNGGNNPNVGKFNIPGAIGPGHAFVIDPIGAASLSELNQVDLFPRATDRDGNLIVDNPWYAPGAPYPYNFLGTRWPVRRLTILDAQGLMRKDIAETIFRLRDDLAIEYPDASDRPSVQRWDLGQSSSLLRRQYKGNYSWLATVVPTSLAGLTALQPTDENYGQLDCDVSVVVFRKRDETPSTSGERLISGELLSGGELVIYDPTITGTYNITDTISEDDAKFVDRVSDHVRPGSWVAVMGLNPITGQFVMKWYRLLSFSDETEAVNVSSRGVGLNGVGRRAMLIGPNWPTKSGVNQPITGLKVAILPGIVSVVTKPVKMESTSLWQQQ